MGKRDGLLRGMGGTKMFPVRKGGYARVRGSDAQIVYANRAGDARSVPGMAFPWIKNINGNYILFMHAKEKESENPGCKS